MTRPDGRDATPALVCLAWLRGRGVAAIPRSAGTHIAENADASKVVLSDEQVARIDDIDERYRCVDPESADWDE